MNAQHQNTWTVVFVANALGDLRDELVLVGGCAVDLLITDRARPPVRFTIDVDLVTEVASLADYHTITKRLKARGFKEALDSEHLVRWKKDSLIIDLMPSDSKIMGHSTNRWYPDVVKNASQMRLSNYVTMLCVTAPLFIATKIEAFHSRGKNDYTTSHDMEDIINIVDGRPELTNEIESSSNEVRLYIREEFDDFLADAQFTDSLPSLLRGSAVEQARIPIILDRIQRIAGLKI